MGERGSISMKVYTSGSVEFNFDAILSKNVDTVRDLANHTDAESAPPTLQRRKIELDWARLAPFLNI